jgi:Zn finger protein HypA/HybF involved in hydrogenase expression
MTDPKVANEWKDPELAKAWVEAGKVLGADPSAIVPCPVCKHANLVVQDVHVEGSKKFEWIMQCPHCDSRNILLMTKKE